MNNTIQHGQIIQFNGLRFRVIVESDDTAGAPWEDSDCHGVISDWTSRDKWPSERVLSSDRGSKRFYNVQATQIIAIRDGWGFGASVEGETVRQRAARAVEADFQRLRAWCANDWEYVAVGVQLVDEEGNEISHPHAATSGYICGIESDQLGDLSPAGYVNQLCEEVADDIAKYGLEYTPGEWK